MAARVFLLSILFTEVLRPACLAGIKGVSGGVGGSNKSESFELERNRGLGISLVTEPSGNVVVGRQEAVLACSAGANQSISWFRDGKAAPPCGLVRCTHKPNGELHFHKMVQKSGKRGSKSTTNDIFQGREQYRCIAKNNVGALRSLPASVQIANISREFSKSPQDVSVYEGEVVRLSCFIDSVPSPNITWQHDRQPLSSVDKTKYFMVSPGVLYINATKLSDAGSYRCVATNKLFKKPRQSKEAKLRVNSKLEGRRPNVATVLFPQIFYEYQLIIGSDLTLVCASSGFPSLVFWTFTSQLKDGAANEHPRLLLNSTQSVVVLKLKNVTPADAGDYQCSVKSFGQTQQTQSITVDVLVPPTFLKTPKNDKQPNGKSVRFECQAEGRPTPQIYWLKDSKNLEMNPRQGTYLRENNRMELAVSSTIPEDAGIYQCVAVNPAGEIWAAGRLQITSSPHRPSVATALKCRAVSSNQISLTWELPKSGIFYNMPLHITVHYAMMEPGSREDSIISEPNSSSIEIKSLAPFANYTMYVRMWNGKEASNQSASVQCSTAASGMGTNDGRLTFWNRFVPIAAPAVTVQPISSTKLNVSWVPLSRKEARGYISEYKLQWRLEDHQSFRVRNLSSSLNQFILTDLIPGQRYEVRVLARTQQGWPNVSDAQFNWTRTIMPLTDSTQYPLNNIVDLNVTNIDAATIKVEWKIKEEMAERKKNLHSWQLYFQNEAGKKLSTTLLLKNCTEHIFEELAADVSYGMELCMISAGEPAQCLFKQLHTKTLVDDYALTDLEGVPVSSTSINITWSAARSNMEHCYEVCYSAVYSTDSKPPKCLNTTDVMITIQVLEPYTLYQFKVRTLYNTSEQGSLYSETIECYTDEDGEESYKLLRIDEKCIFCKVPGPVTDVHWRLLNVTEVRVFWGQPNKLNGLIRNYTVSYTSDSASKPSKHWANVTVPASKTTVNLPGLTPSTIYFVQIQAATSAGYGKASNRLIIQTGDGPKTTSSPPGPRPPAKPITDQSLGIIVGVSISTCCIIICLGSIYCRKRWENTQSPRESPQSLKDRVILRNGNGCCMERNSVSNSHHVPTTTVTNEIELAILCPPSPKTTNPHDCRSNGIVESRVKEPLLTPWEMNGDSKDLNITENPQYKPRSGSNQQLEPALDGTQLTTLNYTLAGSGSSLNNNFERSESLSSLQQVPSTSVPVIGPNG